MRFRTLLLSSFLLLLAARPAAAQLDVKPGVRAGANVSTIRVDGDADLDRVTGFHAGAQLLVDPAGPLAFQPEVLYTQKGFGETVQTFDATVDATTEVSYLQVNALGKLQIPVAGPVTPTIFAGPAFAYKLNESFEVDTPSPDIVIEDTEGYKDTDVSAVVGVGVDISAGVSTLMLDVRYDYGLMDVAESDVVESKNGTLGVSVGLLF